MTRTGGAGGAAVAAARAAVLPLALAQFVASYAGSNMNVAISSIATDLGTSVTGIQTTITLFTLTMAALMIPGSKRPTSGAASSASCWGSSSTERAPCSPRSPRGCRC